MAYLDTVEAQRAGRKFIKRAMQAPLLEREEERALAYRWRDHGDEDALHKIVNAYVRLVVATAARFRNYGLPMGDLIQEGTVGLMQAAERFDPDRDVRFSTYASWWIRAAIQDYVLRNWSIVRTGTTAAQKSLFFNIRRLRAQIGDRPDGPLTRRGQKEIAEALKVSIADVTAMEGRLSGADRSLNAEVSGEGESEWQDLLVDDRPGPEEVVSGTLDSKTRTRWLEDALAQLNDRERIIIRQRRLREDGKTLESLGRELGISKERVRQIECQALGKMRDTLSERGGDPHEAGLLG
ncbi:MAG: RNA polymerase factor sigma-32 [Alphaproteobacteria bacterium]|jgi:RNA polymerase sigma-32 factor|nr:RNA polymerase factor sigma-32 [Alphaproteobacteria bacterium]